jgi:L,D-peptidoglycan transpeptidase YkuD (ErfK/YbiS/YcfS/YnhG family)
MPSARVVAASGVMVAIAGCAALVVGMAAATMPKAGQTVTPLPAASAAPTEAPAPTYPIRPVPTTTAPAFDTGLPVASRAVGKPPTRTTSSPAATHSRPAAPRQQPASPTRPTAVAPPAARSAVRHGQALPLAYTTGSATRVITVVAPSTGSTTATLQAWSLAPGGGWLRYGGAVLAHVGTQGLTTAPSESRSATPIGSFGLTQAFGSQADPGTPLPYFRTDGADWWVSDVNSPLYNQHARCWPGSCSFNTAVSENLYQAGYVYSYAVVIDYNRFPVRAGAGSAFFLHVTDGGPTAGCVSVPAANLVSLMRWLSPNAHPRILIGVA